MPLEIRELHIKAIVNEQQTKDAANSAPGSQESKDDKEAMIRQCIDDIMDILNSKKER